MDSRITLRRSSGSTVLVSNWAISIRLSKRERACSMSVCISAGYITSIFRAKRKPSGGEICAWLPREKMKRAQESAAHMTIAPQGTAHGMVSAAVLHSTALLMAAKPATGEATLKRYTRLRRNGDELARY